MSFIKPPFPKPNPPIHIPSNRFTRIAMLGAGACIGGKYLWDKWQERKKMKKPQQSTSTSTTASPLFDEPYPFGSMESSTGKNISLKSVSVNGDVDGLLFSFGISQAYKNETDEPLEIIYTFPLGWNTTLLGMSATIGEKKLHAEVIKKAEAEERYEDAIEKGDSAIMLQQSSRGLYTANLGNIKPGESVTVDIRCARLLSFVQGQVRISIPTVIGERYGDPHCPGGLAAHESADVDMAARYGFELKLTLHGDAAYDFESPTHKLHVETLQNGASISLERGARLDRDFVLLLKGFAGESHAICSPDQDKWLAAASFCPRMDNVDDNPLGLKILVDCSGSMSGMSIEQAQKGLQKILSQLSAHDYVSYSRFGSKVQHLSNVMLQCNEQNMQKLAAAIDATEADMGGTEMKNAVLSTVKDISQGGDVAPVILLITDGDIWEVKSLIESARKTGHRIFVIGVGAAPAESVLMDLAEQTGGVCEFVTPNESMVGAIVRSFHRMRGKTAKNINIQWNAQPIWQSDLPRYIYDGETVHAFALFDSKPEYGPELSWESSDGTHSARANRMEATDSTDLVRIGRKCQMEQAVSEAEKLDIALKYELVSDLTSAILVYERADDDKVDGLPKIQQVPQMPAYGHGNYVQNSLMRTRYYAPFTGTCFVEPDSCMHWMRDPYEDIIEEETNEWFGLLYNLCEFCKVKVYRNWPFSDIISAIEKNNNFSPISIIIERISKNSGEIKDTVWAVFMEIVLHNAHRLDRHYQRLLTPFIQTSNKKILEEKIIKEIPYLRPIN